MLHKHTDWKYLFVFVTAQKANSPLTIQEWAKEYIDDKYWIEIFVLGLEPNMIFIISYSDDKKCK